MVSTQFDKLYANIYFLIENILIKTYFYIVIQDRISDQSAI